MNLFDVFVNFMESSIMIYFATFVVDRKAKPFFIVSVLFILLSTVSISLINQFVGYEGFLLLFDILLIFIYLSIISNEKVIQRLVFSSIPVIIIACVYNTVITTLSLLIYHEVDHSYLLANHEVLVILASQFLLFLTYYYLVKFFKKMKYAISDIDYVLFFFLSLLLSLTFVPITSILYYHTFDLFSVLVSMYCLIAFSVLVFFLFYRIARNQQIQRSKEFEIQLLSNQLNSIKEIDKSKYDLLTLKHDLKHVLTLIDRQSIETSNDALLTSLTTKYSVDLDSLFIPFETSNEVLNRILNTKVLEAKSANIDFIANISFSSKINVSDDDLYLLLSNLLDNSIRHIGEGRQIRFDLSTLGKKTHFRVTNSCDYSKESYNDDTLNHGFGLQTIHKIVLNNHGEILIDTYNGNYIVTIII